MKWASDSLRALVAATARMLQVVVIRAVWTHTAASALRIIAGEVHESSAACTTPVYVGGDEGFY